MDLDHGKVVQDGRVLRAGLRGAEPLGPVRGGDQDVFLVAERRRAEQSTARTGRADGQIMMSGGQPLQGLLGVPEGRPQREALAVVAGQLGERGQSPLGGELGGTSEMQGAQRGVVVGARLGYLHEGVEMGRGLVREFVAHGRGGDPAGLAQEQGAAQLPFQGADLGCHRRLGEAEQRRGAGEGAGPVHGHEGAQQGQIHGSHAPFPTLPPAPGRAQL